MIRTIVLIGLVAVIFYCAAAGSVRADEKNHASAPVHLRAGPPATQELSDAITAKDAAVFDAVFNTCDLDALKQLVADNFEFYHDKDGLNETSGLHFIEDIGKHCERIKQGVDFRARRQLVPGTLAVYPLNNYGAVETGRHNFYAIEDGKPDRMTESAQFLHIWKNDNGQWKLARVVSYDHKLAQ
ncbi:MAG TPA: nuclear transport factor 2 family protein [Burkholderiales bacterium]|jgi:Domain of unknown function (DUF4440)|nr:nuclear transport factor 2 family protein [Burkholderiales bacterium]